MNRYDYNPQAQSYRDVFWIYLINHLFLNLFYLLRVEGCWWTLLFFKRIKNTLRFILSIIFYIDCIGRGKKQIIMHIIIFIIIDINCRENNRVNINFLIISWGSILFFSLFAFYVVWLAVITDDFLIDLNIFIYCW